MMLALSASFPAKPSLKAHLRERIWGLALDGALSATIRNFHREEVALSASSMLSPLLKVQLTMKMLGLAQRCALS